MKTCRIWNSPNECYQGPRVWTAVMVMVILSPSSSLLITTAATSPCSGTLDNSAFLHFTNNIIMYLAGSSRTQRSNDTDVTLNYDSWLIRSTHNWQLMDGPTYFLRKEAIKGQQQFHVSVYTTRPLSLQRIFFLTVKMFLFCFLSCHCPSIVRCVLVCPWDARRMKERKWWDVAKITFRRNAATSPHTLYFTIREYLQICDVQSTRSRQRHGLARPTSPANLISFPFTFLTLRIKVWSQKLAASSPSHHPPPPAWGCILANIGESYQSSLA